MLSWVKNNTWLVFALLVLAGLRFLWLDRFPIGLNHDEAEVILSAKTYWNNGRDISGVYFPLSLFKTFTEAGLSSLPSFLLAPFVGMSPLTLLFARIPFVLINIATGLILSLIVLRISTNKIFALLCLFVFLTNPWTFIYSRTTTEAPFALFFIVLAIYLLIARTGVRIFYSLIFFILAFFSYFGAKPILLILVPSLLFYHYIYIKKTPKKMYFIYLVIFLCFISSYFIASRIIPNSTINARGGELAFNSINSLAGEVERQRKGSLEFVSKELVYNKWTYALHQATQRYLGVYSSDHLFVIGDPRSTYRLGEHGVLYYIDFILLILGILGLYKVSKKLLVLVGVLVIIAPISSALNTVESSYMFRAFLLIPPIIILISSGMYFLFTLLKTRKYYLYLVLLIYSLFLFNFLAFYFFRFPIMQQENQYLSERIVASYASRYKGSQIYIVSSVPRQLYQQYLFFSKLGDSPIDYINRDKYVIDNILFTNACPVNIDSVMIIKKDIECSGDNYLKIQDRKDAGLLFKIYNDNLCDRFKLTPWNRYHNISDYTVEEMDIADFCQKWIHI